MEKRDELWPRGPCFYYDTALFPPGTDSFCLAYFARPSRGDTVCDLGSGIGLLGTLLLAREESLFIENVELSAPAAALARKTFAENGWADRAAFRLVAFPGPRFWFFAVFNRILLSRSAPLGKRGVNILRLIGPDPRPQETGPDDVSHHLFQREPVFFIHRQQKRRERHGHHQEHGPGIADGAPGQQIGGDAHRRRDPEAHKLAFRQVKGQFGLDL